MIARAMATRKPKGQSFRDLARSGAVVERTLAASELPRLSQVCRAIESATARFAFAMDSQDRVRVTGEIYGEVQLPCQWCEAVLPRQVAAQIDALVAEDEAHAQQIEPTVAPDAEEAILVGGLTPDYATLIEDELLLSLPTQVCLDVHCAQRPANQYGEASDGENRQAPPVARNPFGNLRELLDEARGGD